MSDLYGTSHRRLQDEDGTRRLADRLEENAHEALAPDEQAFVAAQPLFFLSTIDHQGRPTVSYKGGAPGFVRVLDDRHIAFPDYDGNGMMLSLGNIAINPAVGLLFIDFARPHRLRLQGIATIADDDVLRASWPGAGRVITVETRQIFVNCGRYIHTPENGGLRMSRHVPEPDGTQPFPSWKRIDVFADVISPADDRRVVREGGRVAYADYKGEA